MNLSHSDYEEIRGMLLDIVDDLPRLSCEYFHHSKKDQHKDSYCPVETRFYRNLNKLLESFGVSPYEEGM
jgi:hypothetical protein